MKLSSKLSIVYSLLFFAVINLFGSWMIFDVHKTERESVTFDANDQTMNVLHVLGEESGNTDFETEEQVRQYLERKLISVLGGTMTTLRGAQIRRGDGSLQCLQSPGEIYRTSSAF